MVDVITSVSLWELVKHAGRWIVNLKRANSARKTESIKALRQVIIVAQKTAVYLRQLKDTGKSDHRIETDLSVEWTELGFLLEDLGVDSLAERCKIRGRQWADPRHFENDTIIKSDVGLDRMQSIAAEILEEVRK